ncbi:MAG: zinc ribbon domain-containing protein [Chthonomonadaceae bacterium]|nr:zinc ribbon domain-containing protein [Chthonomonadaceae bacterium]
MPTYVYECQSCLKVFELDQRITEDPVTDCACGAKGTVKRVIQPIGVLFKGSGFHINDYSAPGSNESAAPETSASAEPSSPTSPPPSDPS